MSKTEFRKDDDMNNSMKIKSKSSDDLLSTSRNGNGNDIQDGMQDSKVDGKENNVKRPSILALMRKNNSLNSLEINKNEVDNNYGSSYNKENQESHESVCQLNLLKVEGNMNNNCKSVDSNMYNSLNEQKSTSDTIQINSNNNTIENINKVLDESQVSKDNSFLNST